MEHSISRRQLLVDGGKAVIGAGISGSLFAACGGSSGSSSSSSGPITLQYWVLGYQPHGSNQTGTLTDAAIAAFIKKHPNIKVNTTGYTGDQAGFTKITQAVQSGGSTVDVFRLPSDLLALLIKQNLVAPIDDFLSADDKKDIFPQLLETVAHNGKHYSWPLWVPPVGMYLNLDIFAERKVTPPSDDWTYADFVKVAQQLTFTRSNGQKVYGYTSVIDPGVVNAWPIIMGDGAIPLSKDNTKYTFNAPEGITGLQKLVDLAQKYKVTPLDFGTQSVTDIATGFSQTKTYAMYSEPSGSSAGYRVMKLNFDVKAMPIGATGKHVTTGGIGLIAVSASIQDQDRLKAAMELARYLTGKEVGDDVKGYYLAPGARQSVQVSDPINKFVPFVPYTYITPIIPQWPEIRTILHAQLQKAILGKIGVAAALNGPASEINSLLSSS